MNKLLFLKELEFKNYTLNPTVSNPKLKGGKSLPLKFIESEINSRIKRFAYESPVTFCQSVGFLAFNSLFICRLFSVNSFMFHPNLSHYRAVTSMWMVGTSGIDLLKGLLGMYQYQAQFEHSLTPGKVYEEESEETKFQISTPSKSFLAACAMIAIGSYLSEITLFSFIKHHQLYTLFPIYEYSIRWLYCFNTKEKSIRFNEYISISPIALPLVLVFVDGRVKELCQGFLISTVVAQVLGLKRNGKGMFEFIWFKLKKWYKFLTAD
jgi:hypothetical protein